MRKIFQGLTGILLALLIVQPGLAQKKDVKQVSSKQSSQLKTMTWTTKSTAAKQLAQEGAGYFMNIEFPQAYEKFKAALKLDPDFTVALVFMTNLTEGDVKKEFARRAIKSAANKTEGEKLFASIVKEGTTAETNRDVWAKLHEMFPDGDMIGTYYVVTRATAEERFTAAQNYIDKFPKNAWMYNTIAYYYMQDKKDLAKAKECFEKYIELYPEGYNPYDSMGEYYLNAGDTANAKKYYTMAVEKYPFSNSSVQALQKMNDDAKKQVADKQQ
jgi:tetratricopeptide (TPR) repeat protein